MADDSDYTEFSELRAMLRQPLTTDLRLVEELRQDIAGVEANGIILAEYRRMLEDIYDKQRATQLTELLENPPPKIKLTVDTINILLDEATADNKSKLTEVKELQELIKRRCLLGQTFLNSMNVERTASNFN